MTGIPCIVMEGDVADERDFPDGARRTRLGAFIEQWEHGRVRTG